MAEKKFYNLFIKNHGKDFAGYHQGLEAFIIEDSKLTFKKQEQLLKDNFKLIADSMLTYEAAEQFANEFYDAHVHHCVLCDQYSQTHHIKGRRYNNAHERYLVFNGYVCDQCADGLDVTGTVIKTYKYVISDNIHFPNTFTDLAIADFPELKEV
jgi:hypothetical protein